MDKPFTFKAPISAITIGRESSEEQYTLIASTRWSMPGGFCVPLGGQYAVFAPTEGLIESPLLPNLRGYPVSDWYTFKLSRIESQATGPVLRLSDVLVSPVETQQSSMEPKGFSTENIGEFMQRALKDILKNLELHRNPDAQMWKIKAGHADMLFMRDTLSVCVNVQVNADMIPDPDGPYNITMKAEYYPECPEPPVPDSE